MLNKRSRSALAVLPVAVTLLVAPAPAAHADEGPKPAKVIGKPWQIFNAARDSQTVTIYPGFGCTGRPKILQRQTFAKSDGWDSYRVRTSKFTVLVFSQRTGKLLSDKTYKAGTCRPAYDDRAYYVQPL